MKMVKIMVSVPAELHAMLLKVREEGYTTSGYITAVLKADFQTRIEDGWSPKTGWPKRKRRG